MDSHVQSFGYFFFLLVVGCWLFFLTETHFFGRYSKLEVSDLNLNATPEELLKSEGGRIFFQNIALTRGFNP